MSSIVTSDSLISVLKEEISAFKCNEYYDQRPDWQALVRGMEKSVGIITIAAKGAKLDDALAKLSKCELEQVRKHVDARLQKIDEEEKVEIFEIDCDLYLEHKKTFDEAKEVLKDRLEKAYIGNLRYGIRKIYVPISEVHNYIS